MFKSVSSKVNFSGMEEQILAFWEEEQIFAKSLDQRKDAPEFVFYDGPPFATGLPHYGHLLAGTIKDIIPRYQAMRGHYVERRFGWDCHGLPIEALAQEALGLAGAGAIKEAGVDVFNETCRSMVLRYVSEWRKTVTRMGRWVDFDNDYKTMDLSFMESVWWVFKQLWDQNRIYKAYRIMPYSWKLTTPLSNFEANSNYKNVQDPEITVRVKITGGAGLPVGAESLYALVWTTTPWTLPGNLALCVGPEVDYVVVKHASGSYLLAVNRLEAYAKPLEGAEEVARFKGRDLVGWTYEPLFPYFADQPQSFRVVVDDFVTIEDGTGIVHLAPAYGEDDYRVCRREGIELVDPLDEECRFTSAVPEYAGLFCKDADKAIIKRLKDEGSLVHHSTLMHNYPFCERTDTPLIYRAIDAWYVRVEDLRTELVANNDTIQWMPEYVGEKRFGNWLKDAKDWNISRNRFWGSCIPLWVSEDGEDIVCMGSIEELETHSGQTITDLHKHTLDKVEFVKDGKTYRRTPEVLDCWFESGSMPYAQCHYPFENRERFERHFPADFIAEGLDQTRGWFYTLLILSTALFKKPAFRHVVVNGLILAEDGRKMSKRLKNYPDPTTVLNTYGADALRLYMIHSPVVRAEDLCFSEDGVLQSLRHLLLPWWNAYAFFVTYARIDGWSPEDVATPGPVADRPLIDRWILSSLEKLNQDVVQALDRYDLQQSVRPFVHFLDDLTNWYIRRSRRRFWKSSNDTDKIHAYQTLYEVLLRLCEIAAPFVPFISEEIYRNLRREDMAVSVHLRDYPQGEPERRDPELEAQMADVLQVVALGRQLRTEHNLKIRQPLRSLHVVSHDAGHRERVQALEDLVLDELNVKEIVFSDDESRLATLSAKANFKTLGPRLGKEVQKVNRAVMAWSSSELEAMLRAGDLTVLVDGNSVTLSRDEVVIERTPKAGLAVASEGNFSVALDTELDPGLLREGLARELVNKIQNLRKTADYDIAQRIHIEFSTSDAEVVAAFNDHGETIRAETLAEVCRQVEGDLDGDEDIQVNGKLCRIRVAPAG